MTDLKRLKTAIRILERYHVDGDVWIANECIYMGGVTPPDGWSDSSGKTFIRYEGDECPEMTEEECREMVDAKWFWDHDTDSWAFST